MATKLQEPVGIRKSYEKALKQLARRLQRACNAILIPEIPRIVEMAQRYRPDDVDSPVEARSWVDLLADLLDETLGVATGVQEEGLASVIGKRGEVLQGAPGPSSAADIGVTDYADKISDHGMRQISRMAKAQYGEGYSAAEPWLADMLRAWEAENLNLIRSIPERYVEDLQGTITRAINQGQSATDLAAKIKATYDKPVKRAQLIANDQVGKLHSQLAQTRQQAIGVKEYIWRGVMDDRERPEHRAREGKTFKFSNPPSDGHPGEAVHCRCYGQPVWPNRDDARLT